LPAFFLNDMRIDKYLKVSRLIKRRTVAQSACDGGRIFLNGKEAKSGSRVKPGDIIVIDFGNKPVTVKVLSVSETVRKEEASFLYEVINP